MILRTATQDDIALLIKLRRDYFHLESIALFEQEQIDNDPQLAHYFFEHLADGSFVAMLAEKDGHIISAAFLVISERPRNAAFISGKVGIMLNVLTYAEYRRKGIAAKVISALIEEAKSAGVASIELAATTMARPLYEKLGFQLSPYTAMKLYLI